MSACHASSAMWATLGALLLHADAAGTCYPSLSTLAAAAGLKERRTLTRALRSLEAADIITRERRGHTPTLYTVLGAPPPLEVGAPPPLEVGALEGPAGGEQVPALGACTPPELETLNTMNSEDLNRGRSSEEIAAERRAFLALVVHPGLPERMRPSHG
jgi:DNA-binding transcriptional ArsR family regulator